MLDKPLVAFDIETIPDFDVRRRVHGIEKTDVEVVREMMRRRREETNGSTDYPQSAHHRIVCVCATIVHPSDGRVEIRHLGANALGERAEVGAFFAIAEELAMPRLVSWNGNGFDLPILRYRAMRHGIAAGAFHAQREGDGRHDGYHARYGTMHVDLMDVLSSHGASARAGLGTISRLLELPGKSFLDRSVWEHWADGELGRVIEYCKLDTIETMLVYLAWSHHTGHTPRARVEAIVAATRAALAREPFDGWRAIEQSLEGWPRWSQ